MSHSATKAGALPKTRRLREGAENLWHEFWKTRQPLPAGSGIRAHVTLDHSQPDSRQFNVVTGSGHQFQVDDAEGGAGPQPIELVAAALAGCTASDVITLLRDQKRQEVTGYEVSVEADQGERPPHPFVLVRIHHIVRGHHVDPAAVNEAIRLSEDKYCAVLAMLRNSAAITTTFEVTDDGHHREVLTHNVKNQASRAEKGGPNESQ
jgi:putative redox protein